MVLGSLQHDQYVVKVGIRLDLSVSNGKAVVAWREASLSAEGDTLADALGHFRDIVLSKAATADDDIIRQYVEVRS